MSDHPSALADLSTLQQALAIIQQYKSDKNENQEQPSEMDKMVETLRQQLHLPGCNDGFGPQDNDNDDTISQYGTQITPFGQAPGPYLPQDYNTTPSTIYQRQLENQQHSLDDSSFSLNQLEQGGLQQQQRQPLDIDSLIPNNADLRSNLIYLQQRTPTPADSPLLSLFAGLLKQLDIHYGSLHINYEQTRYYIQRQEYDKVLQTLAEDKKAWEVANHNNTSSPNPNALNNNNNNQYQPSATTRAKITHIHQNYHELLTLLYNQYQVNQMFLSQEMYQHYQQLFNNPQLHPAVNQPMLVSISIPERSNEHQMGLHYAPNRVRAKRQDLLKPLFQQSILRSSNETTNISPNSTTHAQQHQLSKMISSRQAPVSTRGTVTHTVSVPITPPVTPQQVVLNQQQFYHAYLLYTLQQQQQQAGNANGQPSTPTMNRQQLNQQLTQPPQHQQNVKPPQNISAFSHYMKERYNVVNYNENQRRIYDLLLQQQHQQSNNPIEQQQGNTTIQQAVDVFHNPLLSYTEAAQPAFHLRLTMSTPQSTLTLPLPVHLNIAKLFFQHTNQDVALDKIIAMGDQNNNPNAKRQSWTAFRSVQGEKKSPQYANRSHLYSALVRLLRINQTISVPLYNSTTTPRWKYIKYHQFILNEEIMTIQSNKIALALACIPPVNATPEQQQQATHIFKTQYAQQRSVSNTGPISDIPPTPAELAEGAGKILGEMVRGNEDKAAKRRTDMLNEDRSPLFLSPFPHLYQLPASASINDITMACLVRSTNFGFTDSLNTAINPSLDSGKYQANAYHYATKNQDKMVRSALTAAMARSPPQQQSYSSQSSQVHYVPGGAGAAVYATSGSQTTQQQPQASSSNHLPAKASLYLLTNDHPNDIDYRELRNLALQYTCYDEQDVKNFESNYTNMVYRASTSNKRFAGYLTAMNDFKANQRSSNNHHRNQQQSQNDKGKQVENHAGDYEELYNSFQRKTELFEKGSDWAFKFCGLGSVLRLRFIPKMWLQQEEMDKTPQQIQEENVSLTGTKVYKGISQRGDVGMSKLNNNISHDLWSDEVLLNSPSLDRFATQGQLSSGALVSSLFNAASGSTLHGCSGLSINNTGHTNVMTHTPSVMKQGPNTPSAAAAAAQSPSNAAQQQKSTTYGTPSQLLPMSYISLPVVEKHHQMFHLGVTSATSNPLNNPNGMGGDNSDIAIQAVSLDVMTNTSNIYDATMVLTSTNVDNILRLEANNTNSNNKQVAIPQTMAVEVETHIDEVNYQYIDIPLQQLTALDQRKSLADYTDSNSFDTYVNRYQLLSNVKESVEEYLSLLKHCAQYTIIPSNILTNSLLLSNQGSPGQSPSNLQYQPITNSPLQSSFGQPLVQSGSSDDLDDFVVDEFDLLSDSAAAPTTPYGNNTPAAIQPPRNLAQQRKWLQTINEQQIVQNLLTFLDKQILPQVSLLHSLPLYTLNISTINPQDYLSAVETYAFDSLNKTQYVRQHILHLKEKFPHLDQDLEQNQDLTPEQKERKFSQRWKQRIHDFLNDYTEDQLGLEYSNSKEQQTLMKEKKAKSSKLSQIDGPDNHDESKHQPENDDSIDFCNDVDDDNTSNNNNKVQETTTKYQKQTKPHAPIDFQVDFYHSILSDITSLKSSARAGLKLQTPFIIQAELCGPIQFNVDPEYTCYEEHTVRSHLYQAFDDFQIVDDDFGPMKPPTHRSNVMDDDDDVMSGSLAGLVPRTKTNDRSHTNGKYDLENLLSDSFVDPALLLRTSSGGVMLGEDDDNDEGNKDANIVISHQYDHIGEEIDEADSDDDIGIINHKTKHVHTHTHDGNMEPCTKCLISYDPDNDPYLVEDSKNIQDRLTLLSYRYLQQEVNCIDIDRPLPPRAELLTDLQQSCNKQLQQLQNSQREAEERRQNELLREQRRFEQEQEERLREQQLKQQQQQAQQQKSTGFFGKVYNNLPSLQQVKNQATNVLNTLYDGPNKEQQNAERLAAEKAHQQRLNQLTLSGIVQLQRRQQQVIHDKQLSITPIPSLTPLHAAMNARYAQLATTNIIKLLPYLSTTPPEGSTQLTNGQRKLLGNPLLLSQVLIELSRHSTLSYHPNLERFYHNRMDYLTFASLPRMEALIQYQDQELGFIRSRLYEPYFTVCLTCRIPSLCPSCSMNCHRDHRQVLFQTMMDSRYYVRFAQALTELHHHNYLNVPIEWRWGSNAVGPTPYLEQFFADGNNDAISSNNNTNTPMITAANISLLHNLHNAPSSTNSSPIPLPMLSPLAISIYVTLQFIYHLPAQYQTAILFSTFPFFTKKVRTSAYILPDWCLYEEYTPDVLFHRGGVDIVAKQQKQQDIYGYVYNQAQYSDIHLVQSTTPSNNSINIGGYSHNHEELTLRPSYTDIPYRRQYTCPKTAAIKQPPSSTTNAAAAAAAAKVPPTPAANKGEMDQWLKNAPLPYKIQRCLCDNRSGWPPHLQPWNKGSGNNNNTNQPRNFIYNEKALRERTCKITPYLSSKMLTTDFTQDLSRSGAPSLFASMGGSGTGKQPTPANTNTTNNDDNMDSVIDSVLGGVGTLPPLRPSQQQQQQQIPPQNQQRQPQQQQPQQPSPMHQPRVMPQQQGIQGQVPNGSNAFLSPQPLPQQRSIPPRVAPQQQPEQQQQQPQQPQRQQPPQQLSPMQSPPLLQQHSSSHPFNAQQQREEDNKLEQRFLAAQRIRQMFPQHLNAINILLEMDFAPNDVMIESIQKCNGDVDAIVTELLLNHDE